MQGVVTHVTDVKPLVSVVAYTDPDQGCEIYQEVTGRTFKPLDFDTQNVSACQYKPGRACLGRWMHIFLHVMLFLLSYSACW